MLKDIFMSMCGKERFFQEAEQKISQNNYRLINEHPNLKQGKKEEFEDVLFEATSDAEMEGFITGFQMGVELAAECLLRKE